MVYTMVSLVLGAMLSLFLLCAHLGISYDLSFFVSSISVVCHYDWMSANFILAVLFISTSVMVYSTWYMSDETNTGRFISLVMVFIVSMLILIMASSPWGVLLGWDGLGLSSYFLVSFYSNTKSSAAGLITVISNRVGDVFIIMAVIVLLSDWSAVSTACGHLVGLTGVMLVLAAITKSAMFPYCSWLPEAMSAPTPVSSLVHSSTLVTAGVYLVIRFIEAISCETLAALGAVSSLALVLSGLASLWCMDFKKIIALSTLSHLSFMMIAASMGLVMASFMHLIGHAMFKSCLFMAAGWVIHMSQGSQDYRLTKVIPLSSSAVVLLAVPLMSMCGLPVLTGFVSKEMVILSCTGSQGNFIPVWVLLAGAGITFLYSLRMVLHVVNMSPLGSPSGVYNSLSVLLTLSGLMVLGVVAVWGMIFGVEAILPSSSYSISMMLKTIILFMGLISMSVFVAPLQHWSDATASYMFLHSSTTSALPCLTLSLGGCSYLDWDKGWLELILPNVLMTAAASLSVSSWAVGMNRVAGLFTLFVLAAVVITFM